MSYMLVHMGRVDSIVPILVNTDNIIRVVKDENGSGTTLITVGKDITVVEPFEYFVSALYNGSVPEYVQPEPENPEPEPEPQPVEPVVLNTVDLNPPVDNESKKKAKD